VLLREIRQRGYGGGYTILKDWLHPQRSAAYAAAVRRFETPPGKQAQVDWGHLGDLEVDGAAHRIWGFTITLGYSRRMWAQAALDQKLATLLRMHEGAFQEWGGVPEEILYDRMRTVWLGQDERGEIVWHPVFLDFARWLTAGSAQIETYGERKLGIQTATVPALSGADQREDRIGREVCAAELRMRAAGAGAWVPDGLQRGAATVGGNGGQPAGAWTTYEQVLVRWDGDQFAMQPANGRRPYPSSDDELRKVARDAYVSWQASRYSVPWQYVGQEVWVREQGGQVEVQYGGERVAVHARALRQHQVITQPVHRAGIPLGGDGQGGKILIHLREMAPAVEARPLAAYESLAVGGAR